MSDFISVEATVWRNNGFGWARLPKSFMAENTVFLMLTALIRNFYKFLMDRIDAKAFGLKKTSYRHRSVLHQQEDSAYWK